MSEIQSTLILLTRNEIDGLKALIKKIPFKAIDECIAVDYKSTDGTVEFLRKHNITVVPQKNSGRGNASRLGAKKARGKYLVFFSPDGNENPADIPKLIKALKDGSDVAIASRFMKDSKNEEDYKMFKLRKISSRIFTLLVNLLFGPRLPGQKNYVSDSINGFRAIRKDAFQALNLDAEGFCLEYQMTMRAIKRNLKVAEIPTSAGKRIAGEGGSKALHTGMRFLYYLIREIRIGNNF